MRDTEVKKTKGTELNYKSVPLDLMNKVTDIVPPNGLKIILKRHNYKTPCLAVCGDNGCTIRGEYGFYEYHKNDLWVGIQCLFS